MLPEQPSFLSRVAKALKRPEALGLLFLGLALLVLGGVLRWQIYNLSSGSPYEHHDAHIILKVAESLWNVPWPDTNWARASLPEWVQHDQYNFSSYILSFAVFDKLLPFPSDQDLSLFSVACWGGFILLAGVWATFRLGLLGGGIVLCGLAVSPLLVQDSFYGRPESFLTLLTVLCFVLSSRDRWAAQLFAAAIAGFALACKFSFAPFVFTTLASPILFRGRGGWRMLLTALLACVAGFLIGVPGSVVEPQAYLDGVEYLRNQYSGLHWPFGSQEEGLFPQLLHAADYYFSTWGAPALVLIALAGVWLAASTIAAPRRPDERVDRLHLLFFFVAAVSTIAIFSTQRTFFERNISHAVPILWIVVAWFAVNLLRADHEWLRRVWARMALIVVVFAAMLPMALLDRRIAGIIGSGPDPTYVGAEAFIGEKYPSIDVRATFAWFASEAPAAVCRNLAVAQKPTIIKLITGFPARVLPRINDPRVELVAVSPTRFGDLSFSTLHVYHSPQVEYYLLQPNIPAVDGACTTA